MANEELPRKFKAGEELSVALIQAILDELWRLRGMDAAPPLGILNGAGARGESPLFYYEDFDRLVPALTTEDVSGGSYSSPVQTTVSFLWWNGTALAETSPTSTDTAYNVYSSSVVIPNGSLVWCTLFGTAWFIVGADC